MPEPRSPSERAAISTGSVTSAAAGDSIFECKGTGSPVVILEAGLRNRADIWSVKPDAGEAVFPQVAAFTMVCAYDRPGTTFGTDQFGRSDPAPMPRTADAVTDLHALLGAAAIPPPYVLAGHLLVDPPKELAGYKELETIDFDVSFDQMRAASKATTLPIPVIVISKGKPSSFRQVFPTGCRQRWKRPGPLARTSSLSYSRARPTESPPRAATMCRSKSRNW